MSNKKTPKKPNKAEVNSFVAIMRNASERYGNDPTERAVKLLEEATELLESLVNFGNDPTQENSEKVLDELADVAYVFTHITTILHMPLIDLIKTAQYKIVMRDKNPNYKRNEDTE